MNISILYMLLDDRSVEAIMIFSFQKVRAMTEKAQGEVAVVLLICSAEPSESFALISEAVVVEHIRRNSAADM